MKTIVTGGRNLAESESNIRAVVMELKRLGATEVYSGCAHGGDACGEMAAARLGVIVRLFPPDYRRLGDRAPFVRDDAMASNAEACVMLPGADESIQTAAKLYGLKIIDIPSADLKSPAKVKAKRTTAEDFLPLEV